MTDVLEMVSIRTRVREMLSSISNALAEIDEWPQAERVSWEARLTEAQTALMRLIYDDEP